MLRRVVMTVTAAVVMLAVGGCRSSRVERTGEVSGCVTVDSLAQTSAVADMLRQVDRDLSIRSLQVLRSASGDTVVTLTEVTDRSRCREERRDSAVAQVATAATERVTAATADVSRSGRRSVAWWVWLSAGFAIGVAVTLVMRKMIIRLKTKYL